MFEYYWKKYIDIKIAEYYYFNYIHHSRKRNIAINVSCLLVSLAGVVTILNSWIHPLLSTLIIATAQIVSGLQPYYPYGNRLYASTLIFQEIGNLASSLEVDINEYLCCRLNEQDFIASAKKKTDEFSHIESHYASPDLFPQNLRLHKRAEESTAKYCNIHFLEERSPL